MEKVRKKFKTQTEILSTKHIEKPFSAKIFHKLSSSAYRMNQLRVIPTQPIEGLMRQQQFKQRKTNTTIPKIQHCTKDKVGRKNDLTNQSKSFIDNNEPELCAGESRELPLPARAEGNRRYGGDGLPIIFADKNIHHECQVNETDGIQHEFDNGKIKNPADATARNETLRRGYRSDFYKRCGNDHERNDSINRIRNDSAITGSSSNCDGDEKCQPDGRSFTGTQRQTGILWRNDCAGGEATRLYDTLAGANKSVGIKAKQNRHGDADRIAPTGNEDLHEVRNTSNRSDISQRDYTVDGETHTSSHGSGTIERDNSSSSCFQKERVCSAMPCVRKGDTASTANKYNDEARKPGIDFPRSHDWLWQQTISAGHRNRTGFNRCIGRDQYRKIVRNVLHGQRPIKITVDEGWDLPGHIKEISPMDVKGIVEELMTTEEKARFYELTNLMREAAEKTKKMKKKNRAKSEDIKRMMDTAIIQKTRGQRINLVIRRRAERQKERSRILGWPEEANKYMKARYLSKMDLKDMKEIVGSSTKKYTFSFDLTCSFWQVPIDPDLFAFQFEGHIYAFNRLVMGATPSAEIMNLITRAFSRVVLEKSDVIHDVHIDNVRYMSDNYDTLQHIRNVVRKRKERYHVSINENIDVPEAVGTDHVFFNLQFRSNNGGRPIVELTQRQINKLKGHNDALLQTTRNGNVDVTLSQYLSILGILIYLSRAMMVDLSKHYLPIKILRELESRMGHNSIDLEEKITLSYHAVEHLKRWIAQLISCGAVPITTHEGDSAHMFTDASDEGAGTVVIIRNTIYAYGERFTNEVRKLHINTKEITAVRIGVRQFGESLRRNEIKNIHLHIDNISAERAIQKGFAALFNMNEETRKLIKTLQEQSIYIKSAQYVKSLDNPADGPSRGKHPSVQSIKYLLSVVDMTYPKGTSCYP